MMWGDTIFGPNVCRLCTGSEEICISIFDKEGGDARHLLHKIKRCLPISINEEDIKPKQICYSCLSKLDMCYNFIESSISADFKFENIIQNSYSGTMSPEKVLVMEDHGDKPHSLGHNLIDPIIELRQEDGMWGIVKDSQQSGTSHEQQPQDHQSQQGDNNSTSATVTVEHVAVHTEQLSSDRVIVLSKVEARGDGRSAEGVVGTDEGACRDILLMVELKYKDVMEEGAAGKVPTITYATSEHPAVITQYKGEDEVLIVPNTVKQTPAVPQKKFQCGICNKHFMRRTNLNAHAALHSDVRPFSCDICQKTFCSRWDVTLHKRLHTGQFSCDFCDKVFSVKGKLERHRRVHTGEKPFACPTCPKAFGDKRNLQAHLRCHTGEKPFSCEQCGKSFRSKSHLTDHSRVHTIDKPYICHICGKNFKWKTTLNMHLKYHAGEQYSCDDCGKKFTRRADLKKHIQSHSAERPFGCEVCKKNFKDANTLRKHAKSHSQTKPYECFQCGKTFLFQWYLSSHMKIHEKQPLSCEICGGVFSKKGSYIAHRKTHNNDKNYHCKFCNEQFNTEENLLHHLAQMHPTNDPLSGV